MIFYGQVACENIQEHTMATMFAKFLAQIQYEPQFTNTFYN